MPLEPFDRAGAMFAFDAGANARHFGGRDGLLPLWVAEPYLPVAAEIVDAITSRASAGWYGYESRPPSAITSFRDWMQRRHGWTQTGLSTTVSPSIGTSVGALLELCTAPGDGVIIQPPVFTDFKPLIRRQGREPIRNPLHLEDGRYAIDFQGLADAAAAPTTTAMILCNPHNPVGRAWTVEELTEVATICTKHNVTVIADEVHADLVLPGSTFSPFAKGATDTGVRWAATHGPIKTFGLAGVADTLLITDDSGIRDGFRALSNRLHLTRNNVFGLAAIQAAYTHGDRWVDGLHDLIRTNLESLDSGLPDGIALVPSEATYLAWIDFRELGMDVPELASWLVSEAGLALSPGHWFGREGAGFARMTIAADTSVVGDAINRIQIAAARR